MAKKANVAVSKKHPQLFVYAALNFLYELVYLPNSVHSAWGRHPVSMSVSSYHLQLIILVTLSLVLTFAVFGYLTFSKNIKRVCVVLKVLLSLTLIGVLIGLFRFSYNLLIDIVMSCYTYVVLRNVQGKKNVVLF